MKTTQRLVSLAVGLLLGASAGLAAAAPCTATAGNLVTNCGFETGTFSGWTLAGNDVPGEQDNLYGVEGSDPFPLPAGTAPNSGSFQAYFSDLVANPTTLSQSVATTAGGHYALSFYIAQQPVGPGTAANSLSVSFGGSVLGVLTNVPMEGYTQVTYAFTATSASSLLSLSFGDDIGEFLLDDVRVTAVAAPVPEPSSTALVGAGLIALGFTQRRRRAAGREPG
jgi:hypothetical protein